MNNHEEFGSEDPLHITSFHSTTIKEVTEIIQGQFNIIGVELKPAWQIKSNLIRNSANTFITNWWLLETTIERITKVI